MMLGFKQTFFVKWKFCKRIKIGNLKNKITKPAITCSKLTIETLEQGVKYVQS